MSRCSNTFLASLVRAALLLLPGAAVWSAPFVIENVTPVAPPWTSVSVQAINGHGKVAGYFAYTKHYLRPPSDATITSAVIYDEQANAFANLGPSLGGSSIATCLSSAGDVAGVCWINNGAGVSSMQQSGFVMHNGQVTTFLSPNGGEVDAVTAVNSLGHVCGTYYGASGYIRSFIWNGSTSTDLGDPSGFGDPDTNYVWASGLNEVDQIVGTVYDFQGVVPARYLGFRWQTGTMSKIGQPSGHRETAAIAINDGGITLGDYQTLNRFNNVLDVGAFVDDGEAATGLGDLGGGGTMGFSLSNNGLVTGTSYSADGALHLFNWTMAGMADKGFAGLNSSDSSFLLSGANSSGDLAGSVTDAAGAYHGVLRTATTSLTDIAALLPAGYSLVADANTRVLINDARTIACTGTLNGQVAALFLADDSNSDGLPDWWENQYFPGQNLVVDPNADPDGDGRTNLQEFQQGSDPNDFYNGYAPQLMIVAGGDQRGAPGTILPVALQVRAGSPGKSNAPLHFSVTSGSALLSVVNDSGASWSSSLDVRATTLVSAADGYAAVVYVRLAGAGNDISTLSVNATSSGQASSVQTTAIASDPNVQPPTGFSIGKTTATTLALSWAPSDDSLPTVAEISRDGGVTWATAATFAPGVKSGTLYHLTPDKKINVRLRTAGASESGGGNNAASGNQAAGSPYRPGGSASGPTGSENAEPLSGPVVKGEIAVFGADNTAFKGAASNPPALYLQLDVHLGSPEFGVVSQDLYTPPNGDYDSMIWEVTGWEYQFEYYWDTVLWEWGVNSDTMMTSTEYVYSTAKLSKPYTLAAFKQAVEGQVPAFTGLRTKWVDRASIFFEDFVAERRTTPFRTGSDHRYTITKLQYTFSCNADPNGSVVYDILFTPEDGTDPVHDIHVVPTNGATEVTDADGKPFELDPTKLHDKKNGTYQVVPITLEPEDFPDDSDDGSYDGQSGANSTGQTNDAGPVTFDGPTGVVGDMVESTLKTGAAQKHFVSPRTGGMPATDAAHPTVDIVAHIPHALEDKFSKYFEWKQGPLNTISFTPDGHTISVPRSTVGRCEAQVWTKQIIPSDPAPVVVDTMNVWVVWATGRITQKGQIKLIPHRYERNINGEQTDSLEITSGNYWHFVFDISPACICQKSNDIPDLAGPNNSVPPVPEGESVSPSPGGSKLKGGVGAKWDMSRRYQFLVDNPGSIPLGCFYVNMATLYNSNVPNGITVPLPNPLVGNDDYGNTAPENDNPYDVCSSPVELQHNIGQLSSSDRPAFATCESGGKGTLTQSFLAQEFVRS